MRPTLPFLQRFHESIKRGDKTMTARTKKYGEPGDILDSPAGQIRLVSVLECPLWVIAEKFWAEEGCKDPEDFVKVWRSLHRGHYDETRKVWLHQFEANP